MSPNADQFYDLDIINICNVNKKETRRFSERYNLRYNFKSNVLFTDGKISVRIIYFYYLFFHRRPTHKLCFLLCRPFVVNATFSTGLVG